MLMNTLELQSKRMTDNSGADVRRKDRMWVFPVARQTSSVRYVR
jgi:hypothetical protein